MTVDTVIPAAERPVRQLPQSTAAALIVLVATSAGYYVGAQIGFELRFPNSPHSILWPPNAILLAAFMLMPVKLWAWCVIAVLPAHIAISLPAGVPLIPMFGFYVTNTSQAILGAGLFRFLVVRRGIETAHIRMIAFIAFGVFLAPILLSFADVAIAIGSGWTTNTYWQAWLLRFFSNAASAAIILPPILGTALAYATWRKPTPKRLAEGLLLSVVLIGIAAIAIFGGVFQANGLPLLFCAYLPFLLWAAIRFTRVGASWAMLGLAAATMGNIAHWPNGIAGQNEILTQQAIFLLIAIPVLYLSALSSDLARYLRQINTASARHDLAAKAASIGVWEWHPTTDGLYLHPHLKNLLGYLDSDIPNRRTQWLKHYHPEDIDTVTPLVEACMRGDIPSLEVEHRMVHRDGSIRWLLTRGARMHDDSDGIDKMVGTCVDVTERKRIEEELSTLRNELTHLTRVRMMGELSGAVAHEINQPLAAILSNSQAAQLLLQDEPIDVAELDQVQEEIAESAKRAGDVIHGLRDLLRKGEPTFQTIEINHVISEVLDLAHSDFVSHQVAVVRNFAERIRVVRGDRIQLQQVILNFVMNACEAMKNTPSSARTLTVTTRTNDDQWVQVSIEDTGSGIAPEIEARLFEPFATTKKSGLGLGLSICRSIAAAHGGRQWAENRPEGGAAFHIILPPYPTSQN